MTQQTTRRMATWLGAIALAAIATFLHRTGTFAQAPDPCTGATANPVACENTLPGSPPAEWDVTGAGSETIQGFATDISVNRGQTVRFKIDTPASSYRLDIYRLGYYGGLGARRVATVLPAAALPQSQPACLTEAATGLVDCGTWAESASWLVPPSAVSGVYIARAVRTDGIAGASHIVFVVRDDEGQADVLFQTSDTTWQAYNEYGGNSLYVGSPAGRAYKVSYNRPFTTRATSPEDWLFNAEYPMIRWLEANGYDVSYTTGVDSDRLGDELLEHKVFLSVGHDEYWSGAQRANVEAARTAGVNLAFFSGNEVFWKTRWESSIDGSGSPYRTLVCYKETHAGSKIDPDAAWTGTWRDPRFSPPADGARPENALTGTLFSVNAGATTAIEVPAEFARLRFWRHTSVAALAPGQTATLAAGTLGYEWDEAPANAATPGGLVRLSRTTRLVPSKLQDHGSTYGTGSATHSLTLYRDADSRALVFGAGTVQWSWGLDAAHDRDASVPDVRMQQATVNLLADMSAQPATLQAGLVMPPAAADQTPPSSVITAPPGGAAVPAGAPVTIEGTASDADGSVAFVEVSTDGGATWNAASGTSSWRYTWTPAAAGTVSVRSRAVDDSANVEVPGAGATVNVTQGSGGACPCSLWPETATPAVADAGPDSAVELGVKFRSDVAGYILAVRYYKSAANAGSHVVNIWSIGGTRLASVTANNGTASGWQTVAFETPLAVAANTTYVASYHTAVGHYAFTPNAFGAGGVDRGPLHALADTVSPNGVFRYSASSAFPDASYNASNYWVDVVFDTTVVDTTAPRVIATSPAAGAPVAPPSRVTATFSEAIDPASVTSASFRLRDAAGASVSGTVAFDSAARTASFTPSAPLGYLSNYTAELAGGPGGVADLAGNPLAAAFGWTIAVGAPPPPPPDQGPGGPVLVIGSTANAFSRYYAEILRAEGLNAFSVADISAVTPALLAAHDVAVLGEFPLTTGQASMLTDWVNAGGRLIAMRPDKKLAALLSLVDTGATLSDQYLLIDTSTAPGSGLVGETIQFHGQADLYTPAGAATLAALYSGPATPAGRPAVTLAQVGPNGGQAAAFTYDLARSIVYTRQGNPAWAGQERDGMSPVRSNDMFYGGAERDWIDLSKVAIPQADEQQRLLANLILHMNATRRPLPRFWYLPRGEKAAVVLTGDDHGNGGTAQQFSTLSALSPANCSVADWECIRSTSYVYSATPITPDQAVGFQAQGFEIGLHLNTGCADYTLPGLQAFFASQLADWRAAFPGLAAPATNRTHCIVWSDWTGTAAASLQHGVRLDTNYYYWPGSWVADRPGFFTGSGMPMRFATATGEMLDVYQAATQMTDESDQEYPATANALLDKALGPDGFYGVFTANMHTDAPSSSGAEAIVLSAQARGVPVVSARQMLEWLDGRNGSTFRDITWNGAVLRFRVEVGVGARGLQLMVPGRVNGNEVLAIRADGVDVPFVEDTIKGVSYAIAAASSAAYEVVYNAAPPNTSITAAPPATTSSAGATLQFVSTEAGSTFECSLDDAVFTACTSPASYTNLGPGAHTFRVRAIGPAGADPTPASAAWTVAVPVPDTTITSGPAALTTTRTATFAFAATQPGSTFQCSLDAAAFAACTSPVTYTSVADGAHTFRVRAASAGGTDQTPALRTWTVDATAPVITAVVAAPGTTGATITWITNEVSDSRVSYGTSASSLSQTATSAAMVTSHSVALSGLTPGVTYYFRVSSRNAAGLTVTSPATPASFRTRTLVNQAPATVTLSAGSLRSGTVGNLASNNGSYYQVNSTTSGTRNSSWYGSFNSVSRSLANLRVHYSGLQSRSVVQTVEIYRWTTGTWVSLNSQTVGTTEVTLGSLAPAGAAADYVSSTGVVRVRVRSVGATSSFYTVADFLSISYDRP